MHELLRFPRDVSLYASGMPNGARGDWVWELTPCYHFAFKHDNRRLVVEFRGCLFDE